MSATDEHFHGHQPAVDVDVEATAAKRRLRRRPRTLITDAQHSPEHNRRSREKQYMILQGIRLPLIALSMLAAFALNNWWVASVLFVISVPLPWLSVMVANGQGEKRDSRRRNVYLPAVAREEQRLEAARRDQLAAGGAGGSPSIIEHDE